MSHVDKFVGSRAVFIKIRQLNFQMTSVKREHCLNKLCIFYFWGFYFYSLQLTFEIIAQTTKDVAIIFQKCQNRLSI